MPCFDKCDQCADGGKNKDRRLDIHPPSQVRPHPVLRVVFAAGLRPNRVSVNGALDPAGIREEGREEQNEDVNKNDRCRDDQKPTVAAAAECLAEILPGQSAILDLAVVGGNTSLAVKPLPDPNRKTCESHRSERDERRFFGSEHERDTSRCQEKIYRLAV